MFFLQAVRAPVQVQIGDRILHVPKYTIKEMVDWASSLRDDLTEQQLSQFGDDSARRAEWLTMYPPMGLNIAQMKAQIRTLDGAQKVLKACLTSAKVKDVTGRDHPNLTEAEITQIVDSQGTGRAVSLAIALSDLDDDASKLPPELEEGSRQNPPSTKSGSPGSPKTSTTGTTPSQPSKPSTG